MVKEYVQVVETEGEEDDICELPCEDDGTVLLSTLVAQFPGATGIKYRREGARAARAIRLEEGRLYAPDGGWGDIVYFCVFPKELKRKADEDEVPAKKTKAEDTRKPCDLVVLKLDWSVTTSDLKKYFEKYGELATAMVKTDIKTGKSKGFAFIRFNKISAQDAVLDKYEHNIGGKTCIVKIPDWEQDGSTRPAEVSKVYVGNLKEEVTKDDVQKFFSKYGKVTEVFLPVPYREFCFVTFESAKVAQELCGQTVNFKGNKATVSTAAPKTDWRKNDNMNNGGNYNSNYGNNQSPWGGNQGFGGNSNFGSNMGNRGGYGNRPDNNRGFQGSSTLSGMNRGGNSLNSFPSSTPFGGNSSFSSTPGPQMGGGPASSNSMNPNIMAAALQAGLALLGGASGGMGGGGPPTGGNFGGPGPNMGGNMGPGLNMGNRPMGNMNMGRKY